MMREKIGMKDLQRIERIGEEWMQESQLGLKEIRSCLQEDWKGQDALLFYEKIRELEFHMEQTAAKLKLLE